MSAREVARRAGVRAGSVTALEAGRDLSESVDLAQLMADGYGMEAADSDDLLFEVGLSQYLAHDLVLTPESRRMTLEFARLARIRDRQSQQQRRR